MVNSAVSHSSSTQLLFPVLHTTLCQCKNLDMSSVSHMEGTDLGIELMLFGFFLFPFFLLTGLALSWTQSDPGHPAPVASTKGRDLYETLFSSLCLSVLVPVYAHLNYSLSYSVEDSDLCSSLE